MTDKKNDKSSERDASLIDSDEFLQSVFGDELEAIEGEAKEKTAPEASVETSAKKKPKPGKKT